MKKYLISIILIFSLVFTACSNLIGSSESSEKEELKDGMAKVFISINNSFQRTAFPQDLILENCTDLVLIGATSSESNKVLGKWDTISEINNQAIYLPAATYTTLTLSARINGYKLQDSKNNVRLYTAYDYDSNTISLNFNLTITSVEYKGESTFDFELIYPAANEYKAVTASILDTEGNLVEGFNQIELSESEYDVNRKHVFFSNTGIKKLPAGQYLVKFYLYTDDKKQDLANVYQEIFHLQNEVPTTGVFEILAKADVYSIEYVLQEDEKWADSYEPPLSYQPFKGQLLPSGENITKEGYQLAGWKEVGQTDDKYFTSIQAWSKGNKIICPVWTSGLVVKSENDFEELLKRYNEEADYGPHEILISKKNPDIAAIITAMKKYPSVKVSLDLSQALSLHVFPSSTSFAGVKNLTGIILPKSMLYIYSFKGCSELERIVLPGTFSSVSSDAFQGCSKLKDVYYNGTLSDWLKVRFYSNPCVNGANLYIDNELLTELIIPEGIETINQGAFQGCISITSVTIPASLKKSDSSSFAKCENIEKTIYAGTFEDWCKISFSGDSNPCAYSKNLFINGKEVEGNIIIPEGVTELSNTFVNLEGITGVTLPSSLKIIGSNTFKNCSLTSIEFPEGVTQIGSSAFVGNNLQGALVLPSSLQRIGSSAFNGCNGLAGTLIIPENVEQIDSQAFANCGFSGKVVIPDSVKYAYSRIFYNTQISEVVLGSGLSSYSEYFEDYNKTIESLTFGPNIKTVNKNFYGYANYENLYFTGDLKDWLEITISDQFFMRRVKNLYLNNKLLTEVIIPEGVTKINNYQFAYLSQITNVKLSSTVEEIGSFAFYLCSNIKTVTLNEGLKIIDSGAFDSCTSIETVTIPSTVEKINHWAFHTTPYNSTSKLKSIVFKDTKSKWIRGVSNGVGDFKPASEKQVSVTNPTENAKLMDDIVYYYKVIE